jgi:hypothetical protein
VLGYTVRKNGTHLEAGVWHFEIVGWSNISWTTGKKLALNSSWMQMLYAASDICSAQGYSSRNCLYFVGRVWRFVVCCWGGHIFDFSNYHWCLLIHPTLWKVAPPLFSEYTNYETYSAGSIGWTNWEWTIASSKHVTEILIFCILCEMLHVLIRWWI